MEKYLLFAIITTALISCELYDNQKFEINSFEAENRIDTIEANGKKYYYKVDHYLVSGYTNDIEIDNKIEQFACLNKDSLLNRYSEYFMCFYRKSKITNNEYIKANPREFVRYSQDNDFICLYKWRHAEFEFKERQTKEGPILIDEFNCE